jgi:hypothetical protein
MERSEQDLREPHNKKLDFTNLTTIKKKKKKKKTNALAKESGVLIIKF